MKQGKTRVLVTGATGFLGRRLVEKLLERGYRVRGLDRRVAPTPIRHTDGAELIYGDVGNAGSLIPAFKDIDVVVHTAADTTGIEEETKRTTIQGTKNVLDLCEEFKVSKLIYISSLSVYGVADYAKNAVVTEDAALERYAQRRGFYTLGKCEAEKLVRQAMDQGRFPIVCLRPGTIFGPGGAVFTPMMGFAFGRKLFAVIGMGGFLLPLVYIDNLVDAIVTAIAKGEADNKIFKVVDPDPPSKREYVERVLKPLYPKGIFIYIPYSLLYIATWAQELLMRLLHRKPILTCYRLSSSQKNVVYDSSRIMKDLDWKPPYSMSEAITAVIAYEQRRKSFRQD
jgi:2-alkyl-3-oxoalkanoate reductase